MLILLSLAFIHGTANPAQPHKLTIVNSTSWPPFSFQDEEGNATGILIELWEEFGRRNDVEIVFKQTDWEEGLKKVYAGEIDVHGGLFYSQERDKHMDFSDELPLVLATRLFVSKNIEATGFSDLGDTEVGCTKSGFCETFIRENHPKVTVKPFPNSKETVIAGLSGEVEAFVADYPAAMYYLHKFGTPEQFRVVDTLYTKYLRVGVSEGNKELLRFISAGWGKVPPTEFERITNKWIHSISVSTIPKWFALTLSSILLVTVFALLLTYSFILRKQVAARTRELERAYAELDSVFNNSNVGIILLKQDRKIHRANQQFAEIFGYEHIDAVINKSIADFHLSDKTVNRFGELYRNELLQRKPVHLDYQFRKKDGTPVWASVSGKIVDPIDPPDLNKGVIWVVRDISKRKAAEAKLKEALNELNVVFNNSTVGIVLIDDKRKIVRSNRCFVEMTGFEHASELKGKDVRDFYLGRNAYEKFSKTYYPRLLKNQSFEVEHQFQRKDGSVSWVSLSGSAVDKSSPPDLSQGIVWVVQDIDKRKEAEAALLQSQRNYKLLFNSGNDYYLVNEFHGGKIGRIVKANNKTFVDLGISEERLYQKKLEELFNQNPGESIQELNESLEAKQHYVGTEVFRARNAKGIPVEISSRVFDRLGDKFVFSIIRDISRRIESEKLKEDVQRIMQHDLKTPLVGIISLPQLMLEDNNLTDAQKHYINMIRESGQNMLNMVNNTLDLYKMETGTYHYHPNSFDIIPILTCLKNDLKHLCKRQKISIEVTINGDRITENSTLIVSGEETLIYTMLSNLTSNAIEASSFNSTVIIAVSTAEDIEITIQNDQPVEASIRDHFFDKYVTYGKSHGTGLGTYSAKLMTETMGGTIRLESGESLGTRITVQIPQSKESDLKA